MICNTQELKLGLPSLLPKQASVVGLVGGLGADLDSLLCSVTLHWASQGEKVLVRR